MSDFDFVARMVLLFFVLILVGCSTVKIPTLPSPPDPVFVMINARYGASDLAFQLENLYWNNRTLTKSNIEEIAENIGSDLLVNDPDRLNNNGFYIEFDAVSGVYEIVATEDPSYVLMRDCLTTYPCSNP